MYKIASHEWNLFRDDRIPTVSGKNHVGNGMEAMDVTARIR